MNNKIILTMMVFLFLVSPIMAADFTFKKDTSIDLKVICINNGYCSSTSTCNISVFSPSNSVIVNNKLMSIDATNAYHNYTLIPSQTLNLGKHEARGICIDGGVTKDFAYNFDINSSGKSGVDSFWIFIAITIFSISMIIYGFSQHEIPPITMGSFLMLALSIYVFMNGLGTVGSDEILSQLIAFSFFLIGATLSIKSLSELK